MNSAAPRVVVLDDDPTGTQAATDVTVLLRWNTETLVRALATERSVYVQTNSRALEQDEAVELVREIRDAALAAADRLGVPVRLVLRGDSTLRGHVFAESRAVAGDDAVIVFVPAFPGGGRVTVGGVHHVRRDGRLVPVGETEFARDPVFGFTSSELTAFVAEKSGSPAVAVPLDEVRAGGVERAIRDAPAGAVVLPDVETDADVVAVATAVERTWGSRPLVVRSAAPLAAVLAGVPSTGLMDTAFLSGRGAALVVCGSHTDGARAQLAQLTEAVGEPTVVDTAAALADPDAEGERVAALEAARARPGGVRLVATERDRLAAHDRLEHGAAVMRALTGAARRLAADVDVVVTKGGITSAEVIGRSLGAHRARVLGQVRAGVSVWRVPADDGRDYDVVIVPGNMGERDVLREAVSWTG